MNPAELPKGAVLGASEDPFTVAATMFGMYSFQLDKGVKTLTTEELRSLIMAFVTQPMSEKDVSMEEPVLNAYKELKSMLSNKKEVSSSLEESLNGLSMGELRRLINALVQFPLADKEYIDQNSSQRLKDSYAIGQRLSEAKTLMFIKTLSDYEMSLMEKQNQNSVPETVTNNEVQGNNGEVNND